MARTIEFDREDVLQKAMEVFWLEGYCKTSISTLVAVTNLKPGSLYAAFSSKEGLFLASLDYYGQQSVDELNKFIILADTPLQGIKEFLFKIIREIRDGNTNVSCFLVNTILEISSDKTVIRDAVNKHLAAIESTLLSALIKSQKTGEISAHQNAQSLAKFLMLNIWGLRVLAKTNPDKETVDAIQQQLFTSLGV